MKTKENITKSKFYKTNPKGISLIVLVITIIVIIILAAAVILTLNNNNPITEANKARYESDVANMQAIFTNTVAKVMAKNQGTIEVNAGKLNSVKSGGSSVEGRVNYTVNNSQDSSNENGVIIFNTGDNNATTYYTGRMLPIYNAGETTWYIDSEGIISLKVGEDEYGKGDKSDNSPVEEEEGEEIAESDNPMLKSWLNDRTADFQAEEYRTKITKIKFATNVKVPNSKIESWDVSEAKDGSVMAWVNDDGNEGYVLTIAGKSQIIANPNSYYFLNSFTKVTEIENIEKVKDLTILNLNGCSSLTNIDLSKIDMGKVTSMYFSNCSSLENIKFGKLEEYKIKHLRFSECSSLTNLDLRGLDTTQITDMSYMFSNCNKLINLNISNFNTSNVTNMRAMFEGCSSLTGLDLSNFDTSNVTNMESMFKGCQFTNLDLSSFNMYKVTSTESMFEGCTALKILDMPAFCFTSTKTKEMFMHCASLTTTITIKGNPSFYNKMFAYAATAPGAQITVNYTEGHSNSIDMIIKDSKFYSSCNVVIGVQVE